MNPIPIIELYSFPRPDQGDPIDVIKARQLLQACIRQGSPFHDNEEYSYIVKHLSRFKRLTSKDLKNMFDKPKDSGMYLQEGHLNERSVILV